MDDTIPDIGSDQWRYWVVEKINSIQRGEASDADIAAVIGESGSATRKAIDALIAKGDEDTVNMLRDMFALQFTSFTARANRYSDAKDEITLEKANEYTDQKVGSGTPSGVTKKYVDDADAAAIASADAAAAARDDALATNLENYADSKASATLTAAKADASGKADAALTAAQAYTDAHSGSGGGVSESYVNDAVAQGVADAATAAGQADDAVEGRARTYTDEAVAGASEADRAYADQRAAQAGTDAQAAATDADAVVAQTAHDYTDSAIEEVATNLSAAMDGKVEAGVNDANNYTDVAIINAGTGSGVSQAYVDQQDTATLTAAKAYGDSKFATNTDTGWITVLLSTGYTAQSTLAIRVKNGRVKFRGAVYADSGSIGNVTVGTLPDDPRKFRPTTFVDFVCAGQGNATAKVSIAPAGTITITTPSATTTYIKLDPVDYLND